MSVRLIHDAVALVTTQARRRGLVTDIEVGMLRRSLSARNRENYQRTYGATADLPTPVNMSPPSLMAILDAIDSIEYNAAPLSEREAEMLVALRKSVLSEFGLAN